MSYGGRVGGEGGKKYIEIQASQLLTPAAPANRGEKATGPPPGVRRARTLSLVLRPPTSPPIGGMCRGLGEPSYCPHTTHLVHRGRRREGGRGGEVSLNSPTELTSRREERESVIFTHCNTLSIPR